MENKYAFRANPDGFVSYRIVTVNSLSGQKMPKTQRAEARCYPKKKVPKKTLQIQKI